MPIKKGFGFRVILKYMDGSNRVQQKSGFKSQREANTAREGRLTLTDFMDEVLPKQEHQEEFRESLLDIVIDASRYLP